MGKTSPIGIFDSGVGGLTVVKALLEQMPAESFIYFGDTANVPYGNKSREQLFNYAHKIISFLIKKKVKAIIIACGTHSSITLPELSRHYSLPMLGVVKAGARAAVKCSGNGKIGIAATQATVNSLAYSREIKNICPGFEVYETACSRFVPLVESGRLYGEEVNKAVREYIGPLLERGIDTLVLGCTHYPFLVPAIEGFAGKNIITVDPSCQTIVEIREVFSQKGMLNDDNCRAFHHFYVSGNDDSFYKVGKNLIGDTLKEVRKVNLD